MDDTKNSSYAALEQELAAHRREDQLVQRRLNLLAAIVRIFRETLPCKSEEEVAHICLKVAEELTGSAFGFIGELGKDGRFNTTTISEAGWQACKIPRSEAYQMLQNMPHRGINRVGLNQHSAWIINDPAHHPAAVEKPAGHPELSSFMGVPMLYAGGITGMIGLANKAGGYDQTDREDVEALSEVFVETLNRRRAEKQVGELNVELQQQILQIEAANRELEAFSYSVSHDLRAPLRHVTGFVELLNKRDLTALDDKSRHYLQVISESALKMGALIDDLLSFSRMGRTEMMTSKVDMDLLVRNVADELGRQAEDRAIVWQIDPLPTVTGDAAMLRLALVNLIGNALKFTRARPKTLISIGADRSQPGEISFFIRDNGDGFDMRYVNKLFGLFQRLHDPSRFEGTGIGLANVQRIMRRHGGRVRAEGAVGQGATFWFTLPEREDS
jgi:signal transduction histidine kinase